MELEAVVDCEHATRAVEQEMHRVLDREWGVRVREGGEWFYLGKKDVLRVCEVLLDGGLLYPQSGYTKPERRG